MYRTLSVTKRAERCDLLRLHSSQPERYPFLLESVAHGTPQARYDILFAFPSEQLSLPSWADKPEDFLGGLDAWFDNERSERETDTELPFRGGWFLYLGYELAQQIEPTLQLPLAASDLPVAFAVRVPAAIIYDHQQNISYFVAEVAESSLIEPMLADFQAAKASPVAHFAQSSSVRIQEEPAKRYLDSVERILRYIVDGDVFQVNLSRRWDVALEQEPSADAIYAALRQHNPAPFAGLARWNDSAIISSSPERLVKVSGDRIETRPIAGTRPRGHDQQGELHRDVDRSLRDELIGHPKERAEHVMLIDLERNDLGRVCLPGTIKVDELMALETYAHVHHIVSNVQGRLRPGVTPGEVIRAVFPGGTITGCPKVRCMEIIAEQEGEGRGAYTGSMGYLNRDGDMDLNILIRTLVQRGSQLQFRAGAGLVADSIAEKEVDETRAKARGLIKALTGQ